MYELSSEARKRAAFAISDGEASRFITEIAASCFFCSSVVTRSTKGVAVAPGLRQFTRIFRSFKSKDQQRANDRTAAFEAL